MTGVYRFYERFMTPAGDDTLLSSKDRTHGWQVGQGR